MSTHSQMINKEQLFIQCISIVIQVGFTPLHYASQNGHTDIVELLIDHGAVIDVPTKVQVITT